MFIPDETRSKLDNAEVCLFRIENALGEAAWAARLLRVIVAAQSPEILADVIALARDNGPRVKKLSEAFQDGHVAIKEVCSALVVAKEKIPNTTPPHPDGLEVVVRPGAALELAVDGGKDPRD